jgi:hypothetical protein
MLRTAIVLSAIAVLSSSVGAISVGPLAVLVNEKLAAEWPRLGVIELGDGSGWVITRVTSASVSGRHVHVDFDVAPAAIPDPYPKR